MIEFQNVSMKYGNKVNALLNTNITIQKGEFVFFVGTSGAGKSTLIKLLMREIIPTSGNIIIDNENINELNTRDIPFLRRDLGIVFQDFRLLDNKTIFENVAFAMQIVGSSPKEIRRRVPMVLGVVGLSMKASAYPTQLSGGEQQRAAVARAIVNNPSYLIADEPTGNLDPSTSWDIMKLINDINERGTTVIVATHDKDIVNKMKKRVITLSKGAVVKDEKVGDYSCESEYNQLLS